MEQKNENKKMLMKKIETESENFYVDMILNSKATIFARAEEIYLRQKIALVLKNMLPDLEDDIVFKLLYLDYILDEIFRFSRENFERDVNENLKCFLKTLK